MNKKDAKKLLGALGLKPEVIVKIEESAPALNDYFEKVDAAFNAFYEAHNEIMATAQNECDQALITVRKAGVEDVLLGSLTKLVVREDVSGVLRVALAALRS